MEDGGASSMWCCRPELHCDRFDECCVPTMSSDDQIRVEESVSKYYEFLKSSNHAVDNNRILKLDRVKHVVYLQKALKHLAQGFECLDASRPWLVYWSTHALHLLGEVPTPTTHDSIIDFLISCRCEDGGFGGGPGQMAHLAPTYAAVNTLITLASPRAYAAIDRENLAGFLLRMRTAEGSFRLHSEGEVDIRGTYCAVSVAALTRVALMPLFRGTARWIIQCQTYEGGFGGSPGLEAHGGYTFCGLASLALLHSQHLADSAALLRWVSGRQMRYSGGFQGRTNKLVDGCYSFWQGALFPALHHIITRQRSPTSPSNISVNTAADDMQWQDDEEDEEGWLFHVEALQNYLLVCCQHGNGGLVDKPGKQPDLYHTCYTLSGLSVAQHFCYGNQTHCFVVGPQTNELSLTHPLYNVGMTAVIAANDYLSKLPYVQPVPPLNGAAHTATPASAKAPTPAKKSSTPTQNAVTATNNYSTAPTNSAHYNAVPSCNDLTDPTSNNVPASASGNNEVTTPDEPPH